MKLRVLRKNIYVSSSAQKGWRNQSITRKQDIMQMWDDKEGWINVPVTNENVYVYEDETNFESY